MDNASALLARAKIARPTVDYRLNQNGTAIGAWNAALGRYQIVACQAISGEWVSMPHELLINGQPKAETWVA